MRIKYEISRDAQLALTEFSRAFDLALSVGEVTDWAEIGGLWIDTKSVSVRYPVPIAAAGYRERKGDDVFRSLSTRSVELSVKQWQDGVMEKAHIVESDSFLGWSSQPAAMAAEALRQPNLMVADLLAANPYLGFYAEELSGGTVASTIRLFANNHPINVLNPGGTTFQNYDTFTTLDTDWVDAVMLKFSQRLGANGRKLGLRFSHLLCPSLLAPAFERFFKLDQVIKLFTQGTDGVAAVQEANVHKGVVQVITCDDMSGNYVYPLALNKGAATPFPWVGLRGTPEEIVFDKTSDHYKKTGEVGVSEVITLGVGAALPHAIERWEYTPGT